ncbi:flagellar assembly protein FliX [Iodidimonas sp. SYSU 1G8]|uniref:flagellar assembly protein FliX n=1 Tax=Iodidimonas sp. SYSU 1G8 TaxID=3133967 RepID=UPI0031FEE97D
MSGPVAPVSRIRTDTFSVPDEAAHAAPPPPRQQSASVDMLLAIANAVDPRDQRERQARRCRTALDLLDGLHAGLLSGDPVESQLQALADWLAPGAPVEDERLAALMQEIDLRIRVELAKQGRPP